MHGFKWPINSARIVPGSWPLCCCCCEAARPVCNAASSVLSPVFACIIGICSSEATVATAVASIA